MNSNNFYSHIVTEYNLMIAKRSKYLKAIDSVVRAHLIDERVNTLLDIGTGDGVRISRIAFALPIRIDALEASYGMYQKLVHNTSIKKKYYADISDLLINEEKYEVITSLWNVFGHILNTPAAIRNIREQLKDGGCFMFDVNNPLNIRQYGIKNATRNWIFEKLNSSKGHIRHDLNVAGVSTPIYFRTPNYYRKLLTEYDFCDIEFIYFDYDSGKISQKYSGQCFIKAFRCN